MQWMMFWIIELDVWVEEKLRRKFQLPPGKKKIFMWLENFFFLKFHEIFKVHISLYRKKNAHTHQLFFFFFSNFLPQLSIYPPTIKTIAGGATFSIPNL